MTSLSYTFLKRLKNFTVLSTRFSPGVGKVSTENVDKMEEEWFWLQPPSRWFWYHTYALAMFLDSRLEASWCAATCPRAYPGLPLTSRAKDQPLREGSGGSCLWCKEHNLSVSFSSQPCYRDFQIFPFFCASSFFLLVFPTSFLVSFSLLFIFVCSPFFGSAPSCSTTVALCFLELTIHLLGQARLGLLLSIHSGSKEGKMQFSLYGQGNLC